jgi:predicted enzyme related to lactoylglutathione lyase
LGHIDGDLVGSENMVIRYGGRMFNRMFPELHVSDCEAAARFFENALGYRRGYTLIEDGHLDFAVMEHSDPGLQLMLHKMMPAVESSKPRYMRLYFEPQDIQSLVDNLRSNGFTVTDPEPTNYGATTAHMAGPDGYMIWFQQWPRVAAAG